MEYDDVRQYQPGDDIRHLDWRLMARTGEAHTRLYQEERERPVFILTDLRPSMQFATRGHFKSVLASYATALIIWTTLANGDRVGGQWLTDEGMHLFRPSSARQRVMAMIAELANASSGGVSRSGNPLSLSDSLAKAERHLSSGTLLYILSDFHDLDEAAEHHLMRLASRFELKLVLISDPLEQQLPMGRGYPFSGQGRQLRVKADAQQQQRYQALFQQRLDRLSQLHGVRGAEFAHWQTDQHPLFDLSVKEAG